jgi:hypothetical protein
MKSLSVVATLFLIVTSLTAQSAAAQVTPDFDFKSGNDLIAVNTDPVLKNPLDMISVETDPVLSNPKDMIAVKTDPVLSPIGTLKIKLASLMDLIGALQLTGLKVTHWMPEKDGVVSLKVSVDGKTVQTFVLDSTELAKIEFEY